MSKKDSLKTDKHYTYNSDNQKYIFHTEKKFGKNLVFPKINIDTIVKLYSNTTGGLTANEIALKLSIPADVIRHILKVMNITHDTLPFTSEVIEQGDEDSLVDDALSSKKFNILQKIEKRDWKETQEDAEKWRVLKTLQLDPFEQFLQNWNLSSYVPPKYRNFNISRKDPEFLIGCSDWHYGLIASKETLFNQKEWNIQKTEEAVIKYGNSLKEHILNNKYSKINICFLGDISHSISGETDKGTKLSAYPLGQEQLDIAFNSLVKFVSTILESHNNINLYSVNGNHDSVSDYILMKMLSIYFQNDKRIKFFITNKRHNLFKIYNNLFMISHGYAPYAKDRLPPPGKSRELYIQNLFDSKIKEFSDIERKYFISGDLHHFESYEYTNLEGFIFPTLIGGCEYADHSGYKSRQRQCALDITQDGVTNIHHFYLD
jgi:hypothetical protein